MLPELSPVTLAALATTANAAMDKATMARRMGVFMLARVRRRRVNLTPRVRINDKGTRRRITKTNPLND